MATSFHLINQYVLGNAKTNDVDTIEFTTSPAWMLAIIRVANPISYSIANRKSVSNLASDGVKLRDSLLVITSDCVALDISNNKDPNQVTKSLNATLLYGGLDYMNEILPGDWVLAWITNDSYKISTILENLQSKRPTNDWQSGFKFVGKVTEGPTLSLQVDPNTGIKKAMYSLQAHAFTELNASFFYDPHLAELNAEQIGNWLAKAGIQINELIDSSNEGIAVEKAVVSFYDLLLGSGLPQRTTNPIGVDALQIVTGLGSTNNDSGEAPFSYVIPAEIGIYLNKKSRSKKGGILAAADYIEIIHGIQHYSNNSQVDRNAYKIFIPQNIDSSNNQALNHKGTGTQMLGTFIPTTVDYSGKTIWTILRQWLNETINEMFTCLRVNSDGYIVPTIILRQLPFTSDAMINRVNAGSVPNFSSQMFTRFQEVPRWVIHNSLVQSLTIGRTDSLRFNFVHIYGQNAANGIVNSMPYQIVNNAPFRDDLDIERNGLRPYMTTVPCGFKDVKFGPRAWMEIISDIVMNQNLVLQGNLDMIGVDLPICEGDNIEYDGIVYHIEGVQHSCRISENQKTFRTQLTLSHGVPAKDSFDAQAQMKQFVGVSSSFANSQTTSPPSYVNHNLPGIVKEDQYPSFLTQPDTQA